MIYKFVDWLLGLIFNPEKDWRLEDREMGFIPNAMDGIDEDKD